MILLLLLLIIIILLHLRLLLLLLLLLVLFASSYASLILCVSSLAGVRLFPNVIVPPFEGWLTLFICGAMKQFSLFPFGGLRFCDLPLLAHQ